MKVYAASHIGCVRTETQDAYRICTVGDGMLAVVCDGMGGAAGGKIASTVCADEFSRRFAESYATLIGDATEILPFDVHRVYSQAVYHANLSVFHRAVTTPALHGMGTTLAAAFVTGDALFCANIGDSRVYLVREGHATRVTHDDTCVQALVDEGAITEEEARVHRDKHILTAALGTAPYMDFQFVTEELRPADILLLCSDGLTDYYADAEIGAAVSAAHGDLQAAADRFIMGACARGGKDNITVALLCVP